MTTTYKIRRMAGPCANGFERNGGTRWHALPAYGKALCGARCKSFWSDEEGKEVTCPRCLAKLRTVAAGDTLERAFGATPAESTQAAREVLASPVSPAPGAAKCPTCGETPAEAAARWAKIAATPDYDPEGAPTPCDHAALRAASTSGTTRDGIKGLAKALIERARRTGQVDHDHSASVASFDEAEREEADALAALLYAVDALRAEKDRHAQGAEEYRRQIDALRPVLGLAGGGVGRALADEARSALALAREAGRKAGIEEAARYVKAQIGTFQMPSGPVKMVDGALGMVAAGVRKLAAAPAPVSPEVAPAMTWGVSTDEESFHGHYATKEEAIASAPHELDLEPGQRFWVGGGRPWRPSDAVFDADNIFDRLVEHASDECGDIAEDWLSGVARADKEALETGLHAVLLAWLERTGNLPQFYYCEVTEEHRAPPPVSSPTDADPEVKP